METLAIQSVDGATLSLAGQLLAIGAAIVVGRLLKNRALILLVCVAGSICAMVSACLYDGQGAFIWLLASPLIYLFSVIERDEFRRDRR